jgi:hypothetical protein
MLTYLGLAAALHLRLVITNVRSSKFTWQYAATKNKRKVFIYFRFLQVDFYNIQNYSPEKDTAPLHTHIIDKCGPASLPTLPPPKAAASN